MGTSMGRVMRKNFWKAVAELLSEALPVPVLRVGIRDTYGETGPYAQLLDLYGMGVEDIVGAAEEAIRLKERRPALRA
jgi:transketolase